MKIQANVEVVDIVVHAILWVILSFVTFGIALFFYPYYFAKFIINRSTLVKDGVSIPMVCETDIFSNIGHIILWAIISFVTFGLGFVVYFYKVWNYSLNNTKIGLG